MTSADLSLTDKDGNTALHLACSNVRVQKEAPPSDITVYRGVKDDDADVALQGKEDCVMLILEKLSDTALINATNAALQT